MLECRFIHLRNTLSEENETMPKRESGTSRHGVWPVENDLVQVTITRTNQNSGPPTVINLVSDTNASLAHTWSGCQSDSQLLLFHFSCRFFE